MSSVRLQRIRKAERKYHEQCFDNYRLYRKGSWLHKPVKLVIELMERLDAGKQLQVLDLGCGVGRNSIPLARIVRPSGGRVRCVDLLDKALEKLKSYSKEYKVENTIVTEQADISDYPIAEQGYDYIVAASSLEHSRSEEALKNVLQAMRRGVKPGGIICILMNTNIREYDIATGRRRETLIEVVMDKERVLELLRSCFQGWEVLAESVEPLALRIRRGGSPVMMKADSVSFAVRKPEER